MPKITVAAFKEATSPAKIGTREMTLHAGAITWGNTPAYLMDGSSNSALRPDLESLERAFVEAKRLSPGGTTYYGAPFTWFANELNLRGAAAQHGARQARRVGAHAAPGEPGGGGGRQGRARGAAAGR